MLAGRLRSQRNRARPKQTHVENHLPHRASLKFDFLGLEILPEMDYSLLEGGARPSWAPCKASGSSGAISASKQPMKTLGKPMG